MDRVPERERDIDEQTEREMDMYKERVCARESDDQSSVRRWKRRQRDGERKKEI